MKSKTTKTTKAEYEREQQRRQCHDHVTPRGRPAIDFAAVRAAVSLAAVLELLGLPVHARRGQHRGPCPLHGSTSATSRCFSADLTRSRFHCFKCGRSGNAIDLWAPAHHQNPYDAATELCRRLGLPLPTLSPTTTPLNREEEPVPTGPTTCTMPST